MHQPSVPVPGYRPSYPDLTGTGLSHQPNEATHLVPFTSYAEWVQRSVVRTCSSQTLFGFTAFLLFNLLTALNEELKFTLEKRKTSQDWHEEDLPTFFQSSFSMFSSGAFLVEDKSLQSLFFLLGLEGIKKKKKNCLIKWCWPFALSECNQLLPTASTTNHSATTTINLLVHSRPLAELIVICLTGEMLKVLLIKKQANHALQRSTPEQLTV